jgi:hypothetical protein
VISLQCQKRISNLADTPRTRLYELRMKDSAAGYDNGKVQQFVLTDLRAI